ncbi:hypothetical protein IAQ61_008234 [Plenodomus lingam]|uniref:uncharacterized protein n=1 Tax=Leptosphaeria maculans TaxID=5022 RepID=UPI00331A5B4C|nr:hypothetical protein IAQ61_008234 [Plenodomus lingam]
MDLPKIKVHVDERVNSIGLIQNACRLYCRLKTIAYSKNFSPTCSLLFTSSTPSFDRLARPALPLFGSNGGADGLGLKMTYPSFLQGSNHMQTSG